MAETPVPNTSALRRDPACATSCSAVPACFSKDAANLGVITALTRCAVLRHRALVVEQVGAVGAHPEHELLGLRHHRLALGLRRRRPRRGGRRSSQTSGRRPASSTTTSTPSSDDPEAVGGPVPAASVDPECSLPGRLWLVTLDRQRLEEQPLPRLLSEGCGAERARLRPAPGPPCRPRSACRWPGRTTRRPARGTRRRRAGRSGRRGRC